MITDQLPGSSNKCTISTTIHEIIRLLKLKVEELQF